MYYYYYYYYLLFIIFMKNYLHYKKIIHTYIYTYKRAINTLSACQNPTGGFGGGPYQFSHVAPTYAAVNTLAIIGTEEAYNVIDR